MPGTMIWNGLNPTITPLSGGAPVQPPASGPKPVRDSVLFSFHARKPVASQPPASQPPAQGAYQATFSMQDGARAFGVQATPQNMQAFGAWFQTLDRSDVQGPMEHRFSPNMTVKKARANDPNVVRAIQIGLARRGYPVNISGDFDQHTAAAVVRFKQAQGFHDGFVAADGRPAVTPFVDARVTAAITAGVR